VVARNAQPGRVSRQALVVHGAAWVLQTTRSATKNQAATQTIRHRTKYTTISNRCPQPARCSGFGSANVTWCVRQTFHEPEPKRLLSAGVYAVWRRLAFKQRIENQSHGKKTHSRRYNPRRVNTCVRPPRYDCTAARTRGSAVPTASYMLAAITQRKAYVSNPQGNAV